MKLKHRPAAAAEFTEGLKWLKEAAEAIRAKGSDQWSIWLAPNPAQVQWVKEGFANGEFRFVEDEQGRAAGMYRLSYQDIPYWGKRDDHAGYIHSLVVNRQFAGKELGKTIIRQVEEQLQREGICLLRLDCNAANRWLCRYYEQLGFVQAGQKQMPHALNNLYEKKLGREPG